MTEPLRVGILDSYRRGQWQARSDFTFVPVDGRIPGPAAGPEVPRRVEQLIVMQNAIGVPQVALPAGATGSPFPAGTWNMTAEGLVQVTQPVDSYVAEVVELDPEPGQFGAGLDNPSSDDENLQVDPGSSAAVFALLLALPSVLLMALVRKHVMGGKLAEGFQLR